VWLEFQSNNSKPSANKPAPDGAWKEFHKSYEAGNRVPVFFVGDLGRNGTDPGFSFGLTRLYRVPHKRSVGEVLLNRAKDHLLGEVRKVGERNSIVHRMDFAEHLFGFVHEPADLTEGHNTAQIPNFTDPAEVSRRGRIAVGFALAKPGDFRRWPSRPIEAVMGVAKPSFGPFYLSGEEKDWSSDQSQLAGRKRYLARHDGKGDALGRIEKMLRETKTAQNKAEQVSSLSFIVPNANARFRGDIRLKHVSRAELGAILWALGLGGDPKARHLMGRAKAFGAGQVRAAKVEVHVHDHASGQRSVVEWVPQEGPGPVADLLDSFAQDIADRVGMTPDQWKASPQVQGVLETARPRGFDAARSTYLPFEHPEFTSRNGKPRMAGAFAALRAKTGIGAGGARGRRPRTLLPAAPEKT
jgi:CRISPR-associated protein (TIGR03986 family)